jgi:TonB-dependent starch-binding outer membrane protein SusC
MANHSNRFHFFTQNFYRKRIKRALYLCMMFSGFIFVQQAQAQQGEITGLVTDAVTKEPIIGATARLSDASKGASTNVKGVFKISKVPFGTYQITVRYIGYKTVTRTIDVKSEDPVTINVTLEVTALQTDEIVITGTGGATEKKKLTAPVETIDQEQLKSVTTNSVDQLLQGQVSGLAVSLPSGLPGTGGRIQSRGVKSATAPTTPVFYVDGIRVDAGDNFGLGAVGTGGTVSSSLAQLITGEVERLEVLRGGAAATLFGAQAGNGIIQIFTNKGNAGETRFRFSATTGFDAPELKFTNNQITRDKLFQTGLFQQYNVGLSGGNQFATYNFSGMSRVSSGFITNNLADDQLYNIAMGARALLNDKLTVEFSTSYIYNSFGRLNQGNNNNAPLGALETGVRFLPTNINPSGINNTDSLLALWLSPDYTEKVNRSITSLQFFYTPYKNWINTFTVGYDYNKREARFFTPVRASLGFNASDPQPGNLLRADREFLQVTGSVSSALKLPNWGIMSNDLFAFGEAFRQDIRFIGGTGTGLAAGAQQFQQSGVVNGFEGLFGFFYGGVAFQDKIGFADKVFLDLGVRFDASTVFGTGVNFITLPKVGVAVLVSEFNFYPEKLKTYIPFAKINGSFGRTGIPPLAFVRDRTYAANQFLGTAAIQFANFGDPNLRPEVQTSIEGGLELGLLNDRVSLVANYSAETTTDALFSVPLDNASGFAAQIRNIGEIRNNIFEVTLKADVVRKENFELSTRLTFATVDNELVSGAPYPGFGAGGFAFAGLNAVNRFPVGAMRATQMVREADGTYRGRSLADQFNGANSIASRFGAVSLEFTLFKNLHINTLFDYSFGSALINTYQVLRIANGYLENLQQVPGFVSFSQNSAVAPAGFAGYGQFFIEDARWIKWRDITIRYDKAFGVQSLSITASLRNVLIFGTRATGIDPELNWARAANDIDLGSTGGANLSLPRLFRLGINYSL